MTYRILLRNDPANGYVATALAWPDCMVEAPTREEALLGIQEAISELLNTSEIIDLEIPKVPSNKSTVRHKGFGQFRHDPTFDEFSEEVQNYRQLRNQIIDE